MGERNFGTRKKQAGQVAQRWRILQRDPICKCTGCKSCSPVGCSRPSTEDDHIIPLAQGGPSDTSPFFDEYHQGLCNPCHKVKSSREALAVRWRVREARPPEKHPGIL